MAAKGKKDSFIRKIKRLKLDNGDINYFSAIIEDIFSNKIWDDSIKVARAKEVLSTAKVSAK